MDYSLYTKELHQDSSMAESPLMQLNIGMAAGCIEVLLMQPSVALKNAHQQNRQISLAPSVLYRGVVINCLAYGPITATQFGTKAFVDSVTPHAWKTKQPTTCHIATSTVAGVTSALIAGPSELVMTQQQASGLTLKAQARALVRQHGAGVLARGLGVTAGRDGLYSVGYLALHPAVEETLTTKCNLSKNASFALSGAFSGIFTAVVTQPLDTVKTVYQGNLSMRSISDATATVVDRGGVSELFKGLVPRGFRIVAATYILVGCKKVLTDAVQYLQNHE